MKKIGFGGDSRFMIKDHRKICDSCGKRAKFLCFLALNGTYTCDFDILDRLVWSQTRVWFWKYPVRVRSTAMQNVERSIGNSTSAYVQCKRKWQSWTSTVTEERQSLILDSSDLLLFLKHPASWPNVVVLEWYQYHGTQDQRPELTCQIHIQY